jgi:hypothetical protein
MTNAAAKSTWKWTASNEAYLTAKGENSLAPRARVYACMAAPRGSRFHWTLTIKGTPFAVCDDPRTAMKIAREAE